MRPWVTLAWLVNIAACSAPSQGSAPAAPPVREEQPSAELEPSGDVVFHGMCDASAAVPLSSHRFAVADDEDNVLRVYDALKGGVPLEAKDVSQGIDIEPKPRKDPSRPPKPPAEGDIEAGTLHDGLALWLTSHARNSSGKFRPERLRFFATTLPSAEQHVEVVGEPYTNLISDLTADPRFTGFKLEEAASRAPKEVGGLNVEGMTERAEGGVFIGFRSPTPQSKALLVVLENPTEVVEGEPPKFGDPVLLDLGGYGVRGLSYWHGQYLIIAGARESGKASYLHTWDGRSQHAPRLRVDISDMNPEAFFTPEDQPQIMLLSDDGDVIQDTEPRDAIAEEPGVTEAPSKHTPCKKLKNAAQKQFRGRWISVPTAL